MLSGGRWRPIPPMSGPRWGACSVIIDNEMWVMGGQDEDRNELATVEVYSPKTNSWRSCTPMSQGRVVPSPACRRWPPGRGGRCCRGVGFSHQSRPTLGPGGPRSRHAARSLLTTGCVLNRRLHVMGGFGSNTHQVLEMTEENGLAWTVKADLPAARYGAASIVQRARSGSWEALWAVKHRPRCSLMTPTLTPGPPLLHSHHQGRVATRAAIGAAVLPPRLPARTRRGRRSRWDDPYSFDVRCRVWGDRRQLVFSFAMARGARPRGSQIARDRPRRDPRRGPPTPSARRDLHATCSGAARRVGGRAHLRRLARAPRGGVVGNADSHIAHVRASSGLRYVHISQCFCGASPPSPSCASSSIPRARRRRRRSASPPADASSLPHGPPSSSSSSSPPPPPPRARRAARADAAAEREGRSPARAKPSSRSRSAASAARGARRPTTPRGLGSRGGARATAPLAARRPPRRPPRPRRPAPSCRGRPTRTTGRRARRRRRTTRRRPRAEARAAACPPPTPTRAAACPRPRRPRPRSRRRRSRRRPRRAAAASTAAAAAAAGTRCASSSSSSPPTRAAAAAAVERELGEPGGRLGAGRPVVHAGAAVLVELGLVLVGVARGQRAVAIAPRLGARARPRRAPRGPPARARARPAGRSGAR